jgi:hypothetical protein
MPILLSGDNTSMRNSFNDLRKILRETHSLLCIENISNSNDELIEYFAKYMRKMEYGIFLSKHSIQFSILINRYPNLDACVINSARDAELALENGVNVFVINTDNTMILSSVAFVFANFWTARQLICQ